MENMGLCLKNMHWVLWEFLAGDPYMFAENLKIILYADLSLYNKFVRKKKSELKINMT